MISYKAYSFVFLFLIFVDISSSLPFRENRELTNDLRENGLFGPKEQNLVSISNKNVVCNYLKQKCCFSSIFYHSFSLVTSLFFFNRGKVDYENNTQNVCDISEIQFWKLVIYHPDFYHTLFKNLFENNLTRIRDHERF